MNLARLKCPRVRAVFLLAGIMIFPLELSARLFSQEELGAMKTKILAGSALEEIPSVISAIKSDARSAGDAEKVAAINQMVELAAAILSTVDQTLPPPDTVLRTPNLERLGPEGKFIFAGSDPDSIEDPVIRAAYKKLIQENDELLAKVGVQQPKYAAADYGLQSASTLIETVDDRAGSLKSVQKQIESMSFGPWVKERLLCALIPGHVAKSTSEIPFAEKTATEIVAARELIRGRLDSNNNELADALRSAIWSLGRSHLDADKELLAKCLRFKKEPTGGFSSEEAGLYFPVRDFCLSTTHALAFIDEFRTTESLSYKLLFASEVIKATGQNIELRAAYDLIRADPGAGDLGSGEAVDEVIYVAEGLFKNQGLNRRLNWDAIESTDAYPLDPNSRNVLHECFPEWKWLKANVPKPSEEEVLNYVKATDPDASARMVVLPSVTPKPMLAETVVAEHSFWQTGFLWWAFGCAVLIGLGAWFWRVRRA